MAIGGVQGPGAVNPVPSETVTQAADTQEPTTSFADVLNDAVGDVDRLQKDAQTLAVQAAEGEDVDMAQMMIATQKAGLALDFTIEIRNRAVEAYQQISNMQV